MLYLDVKLEISGISGVELGGGNMSVIEENKRYLADFNVVNCKSSDAFLMWIDMQIEALLRGEKKYFIAPSLVGRSPIVNAYEPNENWYRFWQIGRIDSNSWPKGDYVVYFPHAWSEDAMLFLQHLIAQLPVAASILVFDIAEVIKAQQEIEHIEVFGDQIKRLVQADCALMEQTFDVSLLPSWAERINPNSCKVWSVHLYKTQPVGHIPVDSLIRF